MMIFMSLLNLGPVVVGECIYIFGGCPKEGRQADLHRFDTRTKRNPQINSFPT